MSRIIFIVFAFLFSVSVCAQNSQHIDAARKMGQLFRWIDSLYVDTVDMHRMSEEVIRRTLRQLDPHSVYISKDEVRGMNEQLEGSFDGIGVSFNLLNDTILITGAIHGGPSQRIGITGGDKIITIDGENVAGVGINTAGVTRKLRGTAGTNVSVEIKRRGQNELLLFNIIRGRIPHHSVVAAYKVTDNTGYIKLSRFAAPSKREFDNALKKLKDDGATDLILDLTGNGGGYMNVAILLANEFLDRGQMIVYTQGENSPRRIHNANARGEFKTGNLVVMLDEVSASASEILAGAIQDWDRGLIVGRRSFGKGLIQSQLTFADSSMVRLTVARYFTPSGRVIQKPYNTNDDEYARGGVRSSRLLSGELTGETTGADEMHQYQTLVKKRTLYGGGGITPDVFVPIDTSYNTRYYRELIQRGHFNLFMLNYIDRNRHELNRLYPEFDEFDRNFEVTKAILDDLQDFAEKEGLPKNPEAFLLSEEHLSMWIKGFIARDLWETSQMHKIVNRGDPIFLKAVETILEMNNEQ